MNRRNTLKTIVTTSIGLIALPSWANQWDLKNFMGNTSFSVTEEMLLSAVADTIIPAGKSIGALSVGVEKFLIRLFEECYPSEIRDNIKLQLSALEKAAQDEGQKSFPACPQQDREHLLMRWSASEDKLQKDFFDLVKYETIRGFQTSKEVLVNYYDYMVIPRRYDGCVDVKLG